MLLAYDPSDCSRVLTVLVSCIYNSVSFVPSRGWVPHGSPCCFWSAQITESLDTLESWIPGAMHLLLTKSHRHATWEAEGRLFRLGRLGLSLCLEHIDPSYRRCQVRWQRLCLRLLSHLALCPLTYHCVFKHTSPWENRLANMSTPGDCTLCLERNIKKK